MQLTMKDSYDLFLNDFQREHYFRCLEEDKRVASMHYSAEFARAQSRRMDELVRKEREELRRKRKNSQKSGPKS